LDGSTGNMSMYFGCATRRNVAAYACYFVLLAVGIAMLLSWFFVSRTCGVEVSSCMQGVSSIQPFRQGMVVNYRNLGALNVTTVCEGLVDGAAQVAPCEQCVEEAADCYWPTLPMLVVAIVALAMSTFPCCFCLCCSRRPEEDRSQFMASSAAKPVTGQHPSAPGGPPAAASYTGNNVYRV